MYFLCSLANVIASMIDTAPSKGTKVLATATAPEQLHPVLRAGRGRHPFEQIVKMPKPDQVLNKLFVMNLLHSY